MSSTKPKTPQHNSIQPQRMSEDGQDQLQPRSPRSPSPVSDPDAEHCIICLQTIDDRTVLACAHDSFCFECVIVWTNQSRKCPLCAMDVGAYLIHQIRGANDYQKHYLAPLRSSSPLMTQPFHVRIAANARRRRRQPPQWGRTEASRASSSSELEKAIQKRRWIYRHRLFAKHMASNSHTKYRPHPTPAQFSGSEELMSRATAFIRRELCVWVNLDVEFLTTFIVSLLRTIDIRSEPAVRVISEFLDFGGDNYREGAPRDNAEHFLHELYTYLRSPYRDLTVYDSVVQYDKPPGTPSPPRGTPRGTWNHVHEGRPRSPSPVHDRHLHRQDRRSSSSSSSSSSPSLRASDNAAMHIEEEQHYYSKKQFQYRSRTRRQPSRSRSPPHSSIDRKRSVPGPSSSPRHSSSKYDRNRNRSGRSRTRTHDSRDHPRALYDEHERRSRNVRLDHQQTAESSRASNTVSSEFVESKRLRSSKSPRNAAMDVSDVGLARDEPEPESMSEDEDPLLRPPRFLSIRNAASRLRAKATGVADAPMLSTNFEVPSTASSTMSNSATSLLTTQTGSIAAATPEAGESIQIRSMSLTMVPGILRDTLVPVSISSAPTDFFRTRRLARLGHVDEEERIKTSPTSTSIPEGSKTSNSNQPSADASSPVMASVDRDHGNAYTHRSAVDTTTGARFRLLRARLAAGKELERSRHQQQQKQENLNEISISSFPARIRSMTDYDIIIPAATDVVPCSSGSDDVGPEPGSSRWLTRNNSLGTAKSMGNALPPPLPSVTSAGHSHSRPVNVHVNDNDDDVPVEADVAALALKTILLNRRKRNVLPLGAK